MDLYRAGVKDGIRRTFEQLEQLIPQNDQVFYLTKKEYELIKAKLLGVKLGKAD